MENEDTGMILALLLCLVIAIAGLFVGAVSKSGPGIGSTSPQPIVTGQVLTLD